MDTPVVIGLIPLQEDVCFAQKDFVAMTWHAVSLDQTRALCARLPGIHEMQAYFSRISDEPSKNDMVDTF
jgi:hypothetical protein